MSTTELAATAAAMVAPGTGILAADESTGTMEKRLVAQGLPATEEMRRQYRSLIVSTPRLGEWISGVILYDETIRQVNDEGTPLRTIAAAAGMLPGIKVDKGAKPLAGSPEEKITEGLDGLRERLAEYVSLGAKFAKWRAVLTIGEQIPSATAVHTNAHALARYAALAQEAGVVPIVEPEVLMDGAHSLERAEEVTTEVLAAVFAELRAQRVALEGIVLKPNMVVAGTDCPAQPSVAEAAEATVRTLRRTVPAAVPGIAFLSGGQSDATATAHLDAINRLGPLPWRATFSFGRALLAPALRAWAGAQENVPAAQQALAHRAELNGAASSGAYDATRE
ncbi:fructose-bisphosphate aldolase [Tamaricihabitans halophyticus]|uniref:Probable fructose-bisphosphate aldolase class 1 n=1 Tax=Tamaricihabitans halophyticus TaxID=1262583 RepID=A0A4R2R113_9PSEU|nr:class I fructose-bisphosphate aldolase [Tamaricihabitans halophyticus]TCP56173.1 fructose-bisphosphate aldolase [Tamaricihabitans halophyticus]